jgi:hypothetical protein
MRSSTIKWLAGCVTFLLPTLSVVIGSLAGQSWREAFWGSIVIAAVVPPALVLTSKSRWRIALAFGLWVLLAVQFCLILVCLLAGFRE